jgi:hypothetical protein
MNGFPRLVHLFRRLRAFALTSGGRARPRPTTRPQVEALEGRTLLSQAALHLVLKHHKRHHFHATQAALAIPAPLDPNLYNPPAVTPDPIPTLDPTPLPTVPPSPTPTEDPLGQYDQFFQAIPDDTPTPTATPTPTPGSHQPPGKSDFGWFLNPNGWPFLPTNDYNNVPTPTSYDGEALGGFPVPSY